MAKTEQWHLAKRKIQARTIYRGHLYHLSRKFHTAAEADSHRAYLLAGRIHLRRPYKGKRPPVKNLSVIIKRLLDERGRRWFVVYKREY